MSSTHSARLERWLGVDNVEQISSAMRGWYGPPIPVGNVPGRVFATGDGDFCGPIRGGYVTSAFEYTLNRLIQARSRMARKHSSQLNVGFASLSDLISEATVGGKRQDFMYANTGVTCVANVSNN